MKYFSVILGLSLFHGAGMAADIDVVREGCNALAGAQKRSTCLAAASRLYKGLPVVPAGAKNEVKQTKAKSRVLLLLNDPESARFRSVSVSPGSGAVCGVISAKNAMGGYGAIHPS